MTKDEHKRMVAGFVDRSHNYGERGYFKTVAERQRHEVAQRKADEAHRLLQRAGTDAEGS